MSNKNLHSNLVSVIAALLLIISPIIAKNSFATDWPSSAPSGLQGRHPNLGGQRLADPAVVNVTAPDVNRLVGSSFLIPVAVTDTTGEGIISWQFDLLFNPAIITPQVVPISTVGTLGNGLVVTYNSPSPGLLKVVLFGTIPISGSGTLFNFQFTAVGAAGESSPLTWQDFMFNEGTPASVATNGSVTLISPTAAGATVDGRIVDTSGRPVRNAVVEISNDLEFRTITRTNAFGYFSFADIPTGSTYLLSALTKEFLIRPIVLNVFDSITGIELIAEPAQP
ncbi:MAG: carboxypeptidase regulatory-like domain-containing protein [Pyrinomonadaceae bacterium]|nr:carboxypeptidase regulatory-like domain-containing protein [Pyrinomonadaceae bacterium]